MLCKKFYVVGHQPTTPPLLTFLVLPGYKKYITFVLTKGYDRVSLNNKICPNEIVLPTS